MLWAAHTHMHMYARMREKRDSLRIQDLRISDKRAYPVYAAEWPNGGVRSWLSQHQILQCVLGNTGLNESRPEMGLWPLSLGQMELKIIALGFTVALFTESSERAPCVGGGVGTDVPPWRHLSSEKTLAINSRAQSTKLQADTAHFPQKPLGWKSA